MDKAADAESKRYRAEIEALIIAFVDGDTMTRLQLLQAWVAATNRHHEAMFAIGGGVPSDNR